MATPLTQYYDDIRAITGDFQKCLYQDSAIASVMRVQLRSGRVPGFVLAPDGNSVTPDMADTDVQAYSLLVYHSALTLVRPNMAEYSYRTRAMSERFGNARDFLAEIKNIVYQLEDGDQAYATVTGLRASLFAVNGMWVWSYLQAQANIERSFVT